MIAMTRCSKRQARGALRTAIAVMLCALLAACATTGESPESSGPVRKPVTAAKANTAADKGDPQSRFAGALKLMRDGRTTEAETALSLLTDEFPQFSGPPTNLGILYAQQKKRGAAINAFSRAIKAKPDNAVALNWLGVLSRETGKFSDAEQYYLRAVSAKPDYAAPHLNLAILYDVSLRRPQDAISQYRAYQKIAGSDEQPMIDVWIHQLEDQRPAAAAGVSK